MSRVSPSERISKELHALLHGTHAGEENILSAVLRKGAERVVQEALEQQVSGDLGRARYERADLPTEDVTPPYRNGYKSRGLDTAEGRIEVELPQVRGMDEPYQPRLWKFLKGHSEMLQLLVTEMYARGLSTRDIEAAFTTPDGEKMLSKSQVSQMTDTLAEEYDAFARRDLSEFRIVYLFLDAVYEPMRRYGREKEAILCCWGIDEQGNRALIHLDIARQESYAGWKDFLVNMVRRGLRTPVTITTDGAPGLTRAVSEVWSSSLRIRCWFHKMKNVLEKVPADAHDIVKAHLVAIRDAPDWATGAQLAAAFEEGFGKNYGRAVACLKDDLEASLAHLKLPPIHRQAVRTTNLIERAFEEERRRTKVIPRFLDEASAIKLVFGTLWRVSQKWRRVRFSEHETRQLYELRRRLGLVDSDDITDASPAANTEASNLTETA